MVYDCRIPPDYFLDEMQLFEAEVLIDRHNSAYQDTWEQTRFIAYVTACSMGAKLAKPTDLVIFPWEKKESPKDQNKYTANQIEAMRAEMKKSFAAYTEGKTDNLNI